jgi:archaellum component FlaC
VQYGKRLAGEESQDGGTFTKEVVAQMIKDATRASVESLFKEINALDEQVTALQMHVELESEKEPLNWLKEKYAQDAVGIEALADVQVIIKDVDTKHTAIIKDVRVAGLQALMAKYLP